MYEKQVYKCPICSKEFVTYKHSFTQHVNYCKLNYKPKISSLKICLHCGKEHDGTYGTGRYCSLSCSRARMHSEEQRQKCSDSLKETYKKMEQKGRICEKCGEIYYSKDLSRKFCFDCLPKTIVYAKGSKKEKSFYELSSRTIEKVIGRMKLPCSCCGIYIDGIIWDIHHIIPRCKGGTNEISNLTYICPNCHRIAHTDILKLPNKLKSLEQQINELGIDWKDYYYVK